MRNATTVVAVVVLVGAVAQAPVEGGTIRPLLPETTRGGGRSPSSISKHLVHPLSGCDGGYPWRRSGPLTRQVNRASAASAADR